MISARSEPRARASTEGSTSKGQPAAGQRTNSGDAVAPGREFVDRQFAVLEVLADGLVRALPEHFDPANGAGLQHRPGLAGDGEAERDGLE